MSTCLGLLCKPRTYERLYHQGTDGDFCTYLVTYPAKIPSAVQFLVSCLTQALRRGSRPLVMRNVRTLKLLLRDCRSCGLAHAAEPAAWSYIDSLLRAEDAADVALGADLLVDCLAATVDDHRSDYTQFVPVVVDLCRRETDPDSTDSFPVQFTGYSLVLHLADTLVRRPERLESYAGTLAEVLLEGMCLILPEVSDASAAMGLAEGGGGRAGGGGGVAQEIAVGMCCTLSGLQARPDLNGKRVTVRERAGERWVCDLLNDGEVLKVRESNLERPRIIGGGDAWGAGVAAGDKNAVPILAWRTLRRLVSVPSAPTSSSLLHAFFKLFDSMQWSSDRLILEVLMTATEHSSVHLPVLHLLLAHAGSIANSHVSLTGMVTRYSGPAGAGVALHPPPVVMGSELSIVLREQRVRVLEGCLRVTAWMVEALRPLSKGRIVGRLGGDGMDPLIEPAADAPCHYRLTEPPNPTPPIRPLRPHPHACVLINPTFLSDLVSLLAVLEWCADVYPHDCLPYEELPLPASHDGLLSVARLDAWALAHERGITAALYGGDFDAFTVPSPTAISDPPPACAAPLDASMSAKSSASAKQLRALFGQRACAVISQCLRCLSLLCRDEMPTGPGLGTILPTIVSYLSEISIATSFSAVLKRALLLQAMNAVLSVQKERLTGAQGATWGGGLSPVRPVNDFTVCELVGLLQSKDWHVVRQVSYFLSSLLHTRATMGSRAFVLASVGFPRNEARYAPLTLGQTVVLRDCLFNLLCALPPSPMSQALVSAACWHVHTALLLAYGPEELLNALPMVLALEDHWILRAQAALEAPPAPPAAPAPIVVGMCCTLSGLQARPDLNGKRVTVRERAGERWVCDLLNDGEVLKVRESNLLCDVAEEGSAGGGLASSTRSGIGSAELHALGCQRLYVLVFFMAAAKSFDGSALLAATQEFHRQWREAGALPSHLDIDSDRLELFPVESVVSGAGRGLGVGEVARINRRDLLVALLQCGRLKSEAAQLRASFSTPYLPCTSPRSRLAQLSSSLPPAHRQPAERAVDRFATPARPSEGYVIGMELQALPPSPPPPASVASTTNTVTATTTTDTDTCTSNSAATALLSNGDGEGDGHWHWQGDEEEKEDEGRKGRGGGEDESSAMTLSDMLGYTGFAQWGVKGTPSTRPEEDKRGPATHSPHWRKLYLDSKSAREHSVGGGFSLGVGSTDRPSATGLDEASGPSADLPDFSVYLGNSPRTKAVQGVE